MENKVDFNSSDRSPKGAAVVILSRNSKSN